ncbi:MAG: hypothetical protein DRP09_15220 [Candidatus Thorarchaeota archaeon]|nr:MAG: hypothetical protein DRP09_15220 [Candidatus Thorarchaeota archaeon]
MGAKTKAEFEAMRRKRSKRVEDAVNNAIVSLRKMGLNNADVIADSDDGTTFIVIDVKDIVKLIERKTRASVRKACGNTVEVVTYSEGDTIVIRVRK